MDRQKILGKLAGKLLADKVSVRDSFDGGRVRIELLSNGAFRYVLDGRPVRFAYAKASVADGRVIDTRTAELTSIKTESGENGKEIRVSCEENGLRLQWHILLGEGLPYFTVSCSVKDLKHRKTESNWLAPLDFGYPNADCDPLFRSLDQKMLLVPYDNDMWVRYEAAPLRPGRRSYDVSAIYNEETGGGLVVGALDFSEWKNAIRCSSNDARCVTAFSGAADAETHDCMPHGTLLGDEVTSSRFFCGWFDDIRDGLELYARVCMEGKDAFVWNGPVPFGWNSYAGLSVEMPLLDHWEEAARFIREELPAFRDAGGKTTVNLDGNFFQDRKKMKRIVEEIHGTGQLAGNYMAPLVSHRLSGIVPLRGAPGKTAKSIVMKDGKGDPYPAVDGLVPVDITIPAAEKNLRLWIREIVEMGFDYIKIDFLSHGAVEGVRYDKTVRTGRQAISRFYSILREELDPEKTGKEIFVDLSIAPLFPAGGGHARRCCCDTFGHREDVRYVLNALNYGWWTSGTLYPFADPDHTVLYRAYPDGRGCTELSEARSRYQASVISGTVMLLSDNFGPTGDPEEVLRGRERAKRIADDPEINAVARIGRPFRPLSLRNDPARIFCLKEKEQVYAAVFNFGPEESLCELPAAQIGASPSGVARSLWDKTEIPYEETLTVRTEGYGCALLCMPADDAAVR